jgi:hypothetical protein
LQFVEFPKKKIKNFEIFLIQIMYLETGERAGK